VTKLGGETITKVDDGTNTTRVTEMNGRTTIRVTDDATGKLVEGYSGSGSNISLGGGGQGPHVTVVKNGTETFTRVDNGTNTATVNQVGDRTMVATRSDTRPPSAPASSTPSSAPAPTAATPAAPSTPAPSANTTPASPWGLGGMIAALEKALAGGTSAPAGSPPGGSTAGSVSSATASTGTASATTSTDSASATGSTGSASATGSTGSASATGTGSASGASGASSATPADLQSLMALSPDQFMQAVTSGKIPDSVANSQSAMMQVQARMNQITQMNQLVTGMMAAMHQMEMSIIQNIRC